MNLEDAKLVYLASTAEIQARILVRHAHTLTVEARDTYKAGTDEVLDSATLRQVNERMHRITSHIYSLLVADSARYPDDVLLGIATYPIATLGIDSSFIEAVDRITKEVAEPAG